MVLLYFSSSSHSEKYGVITNFKDRKSYALCTCIMVTPQSKKPPKKDRYLRKKLQVLSLNGHDEQKLTYSDQILITVHYFY